MASRALESIDFGTEPLPDLHAVLARARAAAPAVRVRLLGDPAWLISRYDDVAAAFADEETMPAAAAYTLLAEPVMGRTMQCMSGAEHRVNRTLVSAAFRPSAVRGLIEPLLVPIAASLAADLAGRREADLVGEFAAKLPFLVITRLLGLDGGALPELRRWARALFSFPAHPDAAATGAAQFTRFLAELIAARRAEPRDDLLSRLASAELDGQRLNDEEIFAFVRLLFPAGADTTYRGIASMMHALLAHPQWWERVRDEPGIRRAAVEEALRWEPPVAVQPRRSTGSRSWGDVKVEAEEWVLFATAAANRDPERFAEPDRYDPGRYAPGPSGARSAAAPPALTFGGGPHYCLGAHLARAEMQAALDVLTTSFPTLRLAVPPSDIAVGDGILRGPKSLPVTL